MKRRPFGRLFISYPNQHLAIIPTHLYTSDIIPRLAETRIVPLFFGGITTYGDDR